MADPVILIFDDELQVRNAVERDLRQKYGADYRIIIAGSGAEALDAVRQLKERNAPVALFLVDQLMPGMRWSTRNKATGALRSLSCRTVSSASPPDPALIMR